MTDTEREEMLALIDAAESAPVKGFLPMWAHRLDERARQAKDEMGILGVNPTELLQLLDAMRKYNDLKHALQTAKRALGRKK